MERGIVSLDHLMEYNKTLVITCHECNGTCEHSGQVLTYYCLGNMLRRHDTLQQESIRHYLEAKGCTQIIVAGHYQCKVIEKIIQETSGTPTPSVLQYNVDAMLKKQARKLIGPETATKMLVELNVIEQLKILMDYYFIREHLENGFLRLLGVVIDDKQCTVKEIFKNGIIYNDLITSN